MGTLHYLTLGVISNTLETLPNRGHHYSYATRGSMTTSARCRIEYLATHQLSKRIIGSPLRYLLHKVDCKLK